MNLIIFILFGSTMFLFGLFIGDFCAQRDWIRHVKKIDKERSDEIINREQMEIAAKMAQWKG